MGLAASLLVVGLYWYVEVYRPGEPHFLWKPSSWWAEQVRLVGPDWVTRCGGSTPFWKDCLSRVGLGYPATERGDALFLLNGDPAAVPVLLDLLRSPDAVVRKAGAQGLRNVGGPARAAAPMLVPLLGDGDGRVRTAARDALSHIDPAAQAARDGFLLKDLPGFVLGGSSYKADPYIEAAVKLQAVGEEKAGWLLSELAEDPEHGDKVIVLCRMLFTAGPKAEFRRPGLRGPTFLGSTGYADWPLEPIVLVDGVPFRVVRFYGGLGPVERPKSYVAYCLRDCAWRSAEFKRRGEPEKRGALGKLLASPKWKVPLTAEEREFLASQIE